MSNLAIEAAAASTLFEKTNSDLKRKYLIKNIEMINEVMKQAPGYCGSFGTGYPFYALSNDLTGDLPIIDEQIRYNKELLLSAAKNGDNWICERCLCENGKDMVDLKQICGPCLMQFPDLKPRKVLNRLPDVDMWMICEDGKVDEAKTELIRLFDEALMNTSDVDPIATIKDVSQIVEDLGNGIMPEKMLPLDVHIIECSKMKQLMLQMPWTLHYAMVRENSPYLPINPYSLRKEWQNNDTYNFVLDFMYTLTPFDWDEELERSLDYTRNVISLCFSTEDIESILHKVASPVVERRFENKQLQDCYKRRIKSWGKR